MVSQGKSFSALGTVNCGRSSGVSAVMAVRALPTCSNAVPRCGGATASRPRSTTCAARPPRPAPRPAPPPRSCRPRSRCRLCVSLSPVLSTAPHHQDVSCFQPSREPSTLAHIHATLPAGVLTPPLRKQISYLSFCSHQRQQLCNDPCQQHSSQALMPSSEDYTQHELVCCNFLCFVM